MGVNSFLLDRRTATLLIGDTRHTVGTLRRFYKLTEMDDERAAELKAAANVTPSPVAVIVIDVIDLPTAAKPSEPAAAHLVLGWDEGRGSATDLGWDYLPRLGFALRDPDGGDYVLHERLGGFLHRMDTARAREIGFLGADGKLIRRGQPHIIECRSVRPSITGYAEADCILDGGVEDTLFLAVPIGLLPPPDWFVGKRPMDVTRYSADSD